MAPDLSADIISADIQSNLERGESTENDTLDSPQKDAKDGAGEGEASTRLTLRDMRYNANAHAFAQSAGMPLTAHAILHLERSRQFDPSPQEWTIWQGRFLDKLSRWCIRQDIPPAYLWTKEIGARKGAHLHMLMHIPDWKIIPDLIAFIAETADMEPDDADGRAVVVKGGTYGMRSRRMQAGALRYLCKSVDDDLGPKLGIRPVPNASPVVGRRYGVSHSIGPVSRKAAGWQEMTDLNRLNLYFNP